MADPPRDAPPARDAPPTAAPPPRDAGARETLVFRIAMATVLAHVVTDAWVGRPDGPAGDRLIATLVPAAVGVALAVAYPRLRAGMRGTAAIACGALAITGGAVALAGDDPVGVLPSLGGAVLVVLGAASLWRSRKPTGRPLLRRSLLGVAAVVAGYLVLLPVGIAIVATHHHEAPVADADLGREHERVRLRTADGLELAAWYVPSRNGAAVIAFPGRRAPVPHARLLARHGYGVLLLDRRGEGTSEGDYNAFGWDGEADLRAAADFLEARPDVDPDRIGGLGLSVGGEMLIAAAARGDGLRAVVSEGAGIRSMAEQRHWPDVPAPLRWVSPMLATTAATAVLSGDLPPGDLVELAGRVPGGRLLLIRSLEGHADERMNRVYRDAADAELWETDAGGHTDALAAAPDEYERRVIGFLDRELLGDRGRRVG